MGHISGIMGHRWHCGVGDREWGIIEYIWAWAWGADMGDT